MSQVDELVTAVAAQVADASVSFVCGKLRINEHAQQRTVIFVRATGVLKFSAAPGRQVATVPVSGAGTTQLQRFAREELIETTVRAEDEDELDELFDAVANAIFDLGGPNVFAAENTYEWIGRDSQRAGKVLSRNPELKFYFKIRLTSHPKPKPYAILAAATGTLTEGPPGQPVTVVQP